MRASLLIHSLENSYSQNESLSLVSRRVVSIWLEKLKDLDIFRSCEQKNKNRNKYRSVKWRDIKIYAYREKREWDMNRNDHHKSMSEKMITFVDCHRLKRDASHFKFVKTKSHKKKTTNNKKSLWHSSHSVFNINFGLYVRKWRWPHTIYALVIL